jgi:hypothetical protein
MMKSHPIDLAGIKRAFVVLAAGWALSWGAAQEEKATSASASVRDTISGEFNLTKELAGEKRDKSKSGWTPTLALTPKFGYATNIFSSPEEANGISGLEQESWTAGIAGKLSLARQYERWLIGISGEAHELAYDEAEHIDVSRQRLSVWSDVKLAAPTKLAVDLGFQKKNNDAVNIFGERLNATSNPADRDELDEADDSYSLKIYTGALEASHEFNKRHDLKLAVAGRYQNVISNVSDPDWYRFGPTLKYRYRPAAGIALRLHCDFQTQRYEDISARAQDGSAPLDGPKREHEYQKFLVEFTRKLTEKCQLQLKLRVQIKNDRYQDFESYRDNGVEAGIDYRLTAVTLMESKISYKNRDFAHRLSDNPNETLNHDYYGFSLRCNHALSTHLVVTFHYDYIQRESNRQTGKTFREYENHLLTSSLTYAF